MLDEPTARELDQLIATYEADRHAWATFAPGTEFPRHLHGDLDHIRK